MDGPRCFQVLQTPVHLQINPSKAKKEPDLIPSPCKNNPIFAAKSYFGGALVEQLACAHVSTYIYLPPKAGFLHQTIPRIVTTQKISAMFSPFLDELRKQTSSYLKEKIRSARLALTDVTPAELLAEAATDGSAHGPYPGTLKVLSRAAFEVDDYRRITDVIQRKLSRKNDGKHWRESYKALILLEYLLTHGPLSTSRDFREDKDDILQLRFLGDVDDDGGFNWGLAVKQRAERVLQLLEGGSQLSEERDRACRLSRGIEGFGGCREGGGGGGAVATIRGEVNSPCSVVVNKGRGGEPESLRGIYGGVDELRRPLLRCQ